MTNSTGIYNEDSMTAQQLAIASANKIKECLLMVDDLATAVDNIKTFIGYNDVTEEMALSIDGKISALREQINSSYVSIYNENAMSALELSGQSAKMANECVKTVNMICDIVDELNNYVNMSYVTSDEMLTIGGKDE